MSRESKRNDVTKKTLVYRVAGMEDVPVHRDVLYSARGGDALLLDLYTPAGAAPDAGHPAVFLVAGYPDPGFEARLGCKFKDMGSSTSWAGLIAASGLAAITYTNRDPGDDVHTVLAYVHDNGASLGIDVGRLGLWASSGSVPTALSALMLPEGVVRCGVLCYGFMLDPDGTLGIAAAAKQWGFAYPCAGKSIEDVLPKRPLFIVRAGGDTFAGLNPSIDAFVSGGLARNLPLTLVNHSEGQHAFDLFEDTATSREVLRNAIGFLRFYLSELPGRGGGAV